jgi:hypothetical protein
MVSFSVPVAGGGPEFRFSVQELGVLFAGSRHGGVPPAVCRDLIQGLAADGFCFWVGCAAGVDRCFRKALSESTYTDRVFVGCAFRSRVRALSNYGLFGSVVVPEGQPQSSTSQKNPVACQTELPVGAGSRRSYYRSLGQRFPVSIQICPGSTQTRVCNLLLFP